MSRSVGRKRTLLFPPLEPELTQSSDHNEDIRSIYGMFLQPLVPNTILLKQPLKLRPFEFLAASDRTTDERIFCRNFVRFVSANFYYKGFQKSCCFYLNQNKQQTGWNFVLCTVVWSLATRKSNGFEQVRDWQRKKSLW